jgi:hypothetical protein
VLAWRVYRYDRRIVIALSRNSPPGPFVGKAGLASERGVVRDLWTKHRHFALMHDLTSALRIVDLTELQANGFCMLREVKTNPKASASRQIRLAETALASIDGSNPLPGRDPDLEPFLWRSSAQLRTHVRELQPMIDQASARGFWVGRTGDRVVGVANLLVAAQNAGTRPSSGLTTWKVVMRRSADIYLPRSTA